MQNWILPLCTLQNNVRRKKQYFNTYDIYNTCELTLSHMQYLSILQRHYWVKSYYNETKVVLVHLSLVLRQKPPKGWSCHGTWVGNHVGLEVWGVGKGWDAKIHAFRQAVWLAHVHYSPGVLMCALLVNKISITWSDKVYLAKYVIRSHCLHVCVLPFRVQTWHWRRLTVL